jgi:hypothetical protein
MNNEVTLKEAIQKLIKTYELQGKLTENHLNNSWEQIMGKMVANYTRSLQLNNGRLVVRLNSSVLRQELSSNKTQVINRLNEYFGREVVKDLVLK